MVTNSIETRIEPETDSIVMSHLQASTLEPTLNIEPLIGLGAVENTL